MKNEKVDTALHIIKGAAQKVLGTKLTTTVFGEGNIGRLTVEFDRKPTDDEISEIEHLSNAKVKENIPVNVIEMDREKAEKKYGKIMYDKFEVPKHITKLSVLVIDNWNINCCNGKHVKTSGEVGKIKFRKFEFRNSKKELEIGFEITEKVKLDKNIEKRLTLIKEVGIEIVDEDELIELLKSKEEFIAYDGFEPSGVIHIAQGLMRTINVNKMIQAGAHFKMLVADWHAWANNKMGGDLEKIQTVGKYFIEVWKACGMDLDHIEFVWANDAVSDPEYWKIVMQIAINSTIKRIVRCGTILGRTESEMRQSSQIFAPVMQAADIFYLKADVCQLGLDQRKVNILARELGPKLGFWKPVIVSHGMLLGLKQPISNELDPEKRTIALKMSKSKPDTAVFMTDSEEDIYRKIKNAWCPEKEAKENPILEWCKKIVFEKYDSFEIKRPEKFGGNVTYNSYADLEKAFIDGKVHPLDLKQSTAFYINELIKPVREHFEKDPKAKKLKEQVESFQVTR
ncbi:MAG: tyrosine--tRNA ligase [archaeon]